MDRTQDQFYPTTPSVFHMDGHRHFRYRTRTNQWNSMTSTAVELQGMVKRTRKDDKRISPVVPKEQATSKRIRWFYDIRPNKRQHCRVGPERIPIQTDHLAAPTTLSYWRHKSVQCP